MNIITPLYIPVNQDTLDKLVQADDLSLLEEILSNSHWCELPTVMTIQYLPEAIKTSKPQASVERFLHKAFSFANSLKAHIDKDLLVKEILNILNTEKLREGLSLINSFHLRFLPENDIEKRKYLDFNRQWDFSFKNNYISKSKFEWDDNSGYKNYLNKEQYRIVSTIKANPEDNLHVEGLAGTGKTRQVSAILEILTNKGIPLNEVLVLTPTPQQRKALISKLPKGIKVTTFHWLAGDWLKRSYRGKYTDDYVGISDIRYVERFGIKPLRNLPANRIVEIARNTVSNYCFTNDISIGQQHIPAWSGLKQNVISENNTNQKRLAAEAVLACANQYWELLTPNSDQKTRPKVLPYHWIKLASLYANINLIPSPTHILIDESHNIPPAMESIITQMNASIISLGDRFQSIDRISKKPSYAERQRYISKCMRSGSNLDEIVNPILSIHPSQTENVFEGDRSRRTEIETYQKAEIPKHECAIFVGSEWGLLEWAQRLSKEGIRFRLLDERKSIDQFVQDVIELYKNNTPPRHNYIYQCVDWDAVYDKFKDNSSFIKVSKLLDQGYNLSHWEDTSNKITDDLYSRYTLSTIRNARNSEYDSVYLTPDALDLTRSPNKALFKIASELYIGATRVRNKLYIPETMRNWIEENYK